jgi:hypothetical protein
MMGWKQQVRMKVEINDRVETTSADENRINDGWKQRVRMKVEINDGVETTSADES